MKTTHLIAPAALLGLLCLTYSADARTPARRINSSYHIQQLANRASYQARRIVQQTRLLPGNGPRVQTLRQQANRSLQLSRRIQQSAHLATHRRGGRGRGFVAYTPSQNINQQVRRLDGLVHRMQESVNLMRPDIVGRVPRNRRGGQVQVAIQDEIFAPDQRRGPFRPRNTALNRLRVSLNQMQSTVHHLVEDTAGPRIRPFDGGPQVVPGATGPALPPVAGGSRNRQARGGR